MKDKFFILSFVMIVYTLSPSASYAGDAFLKGGYMIFTDSDLDDKNSVLAAGGSDWLFDAPFGFFSGGVEVQYSFSRVKILTTTGYQEYYTDITLHFFNAYGNFKAHFGRENKVRPFVGSGFGVITQGTSVLGFDQHAFGVQILGGLVIGKPSGSSFSTGVSFIAEVQYKIPTGEMSYNKSLNILGGVVF